MVETEVPAPPSLWLLIDLSPLGVGLSSRASFSQLRRLEVMDCIPPLSDLWSLQPPCSITSGSRQRGGRCRGMEVMKAFIRQSVFVAETLSAAVISRVRFDRFLLKHRWQQADRASDVRPDKSSLNGADTRLHHCSRIINTGQRCKWIWQIRRGGRKWSSFSFRQTMEEFGPRDLPQELWVYYYLILLLHN